MLCRQSSDIEVSKKVSKQVCKIIGVENHTSLTESTLWWCLFGVRPVLRRRGRRWAGRSARNASRATHRRSRVRRQPAADGARSIAGLRPCATSCR